MSVISQLGFKVIELINDQVERGIDVDGKRYEYSERPFVLPSGKKKFAKSLLKPESDGGRLAQFQTSKGKLWYLVHGGYKDWRRLNNRNPDGDFLQWSGQMLRSLSSRAEGDTSTSLSGRATVYFTDAAAAQKAFWFNVSGVGKGRKLWKFFGLTKENEAKLAEYAAELLGKDSGAVTAKILQDFDFS